MVGQSLVVVRLYKIATTICVYVRAWGLSWVSIGLPCRMPAPPTNYIIVTQLNIENVFESRTTLQIGKFICETRC